MQALPEKGGFHGPLILRGPSRDEGDIAFLDAVGLHLTAKRACSGAGFSDEGEPAGLAVESGDDGDLASVDSLVGEQIAKVMPKGGAVGGLARMGRHLGGFVDHDPVFRLVQNDGISRAQAGRGDGVWRDRAHAKKEAPDRGLSQVLAAVGSREVLGLLTQSRFRRTIFVQIAGGPEYASGDQVEIAIITDSGVVMTNGRAEDTGFAEVSIGPSDDRFDCFFGRFAFFGVLLLDELLPARQRASGVKYLNVVVQFFLCRGPVREPFDDWRGLVEVGDFDWLLGAMAAGLKSKVLKPHAARGSQCRRFGWVSDPVRVHGAVEVQTWGALLVRSEHTFNHLFVTDAGGTFIMDYEVVPLGVIGIAVDRDGRLGAFVVGVDLVHLGMEALLNSCFEKVLLVGVIVATTTRD